MTSAEARQPDSAEGLTLSIDAMGGDRGPAAVLDGLAKVCRKSADVRFIVHGPEPELTGLLRKRSGLRACCEVRHAESVVAMSDKPRDVMRRASATSMGSAIDTVGRGEAHAVVSCGNTGALMLMAVSRLKTAPGVDRPGIAVLWPSRTAAGYNIVLDVGASLKAEPEILVQFAAMGAEYARVAFGLERPRVGLLNIGSEETKGVPELRAASELLQRNAEPVGYAWGGFVEGGDLCGDRVDVIVTDGFTGNVALKTAEGVATFIGEQLKASFMHSLFSRAVGLMAMTTLGRMRRRIDPRRVNGGVFLGLNGAVVKGHGGSDATGVAAAVGLAARMARTGFAEQVAKRVARGLETGDAAGGGADGRLSPGARTAAQ